MAIEASKCCLMYMPSVDLNLGGCLPDCKVGHQAAGVGDDSPHGHGHEEHLEQVHRGDEPLAMSLPPYHSVVGMARVGGAGTKMKKSVDLITNRAPKSMEGGRGGD
jgi:hypothetical protein